VIGLEASLVQATLEESERARHLRCHVGRYPLHQTDIAAVAPLLARRLRPAFVKTFGSNPVLDLARRHILDRFVPRLAHSTSAP